GERRHIQLTVERDSKFNIYVCLEKTQIDFRELGQEDLQNRNELFCGDGCLIIILPGYPPTQTQRRPRNLTDLPDVAKRHAAQLLSENNPDHRDAAAIPNMLNLNAQIIDPFLNTPVLNPLIKIG